MAPGTPRPGRSWSAVAAVVVAAIGVVMGLGAAGVLQLGALVPRTEVQAAGESTPAPIAMAGRPEDVPVREAARVMPSDVRAWLEHLERMEKKKNELHERQANEARALASSLTGGGLNLQDVDSILDPGAGMPDPRNIVDELIDKIAPPWVDLRKEFLETGPPMPLECKPIATQFETGISQMVSKVEQIRDIMNAFDPASVSATSEAGEKQTELGAMKRDHKQVVDNAFKATDDLLAQICRKYQARKWFDIDQGVLGGSPLAGF